MGIALAIGERIANSLTSGWRMLSFAACERPRCPQGGVESQKDGLVDHLPGAGVRRLNTADHRTG